MFVIDCISQALAWIYLEDDLAEVKRFSFRGALEIYTLVEELDEADDLAAKGNAGGASEARRPLSLLADKVNPKDAGVLERKLRAICEDPATECLGMIWDTIQEGAEQQNASSSK